MNTKIKAQVCELFKESSSIDYIRETLPNENVDDIIELLIKENLLVNRPKKQYMAGVLTYVVSDEDILPRVKFALANGTPKKRICKQFHIGGTRLNKLIQKYELASNEQPNTVDQIEEQIISEPTIDKEQLTEEPKIEQTKIEQVVEQTEIETEQVSETTNETILSDFELKELIDKGLQEGKAKKRIAHELHIGLKKLNRIINTNKDELSNKPTKATLITAKLVGQIQTYLRYDTKPEIIAKNLSISVNAVKTIKKLLKLTQVPAGKETTEMQTPTIEEKIVYANKVYGVGRWKFLTKEECLKLWKAKNALNDDNFGDIDDDFYDY